MKRILSTVLACALILCCVLALASCSKATESYAKKINEAADADEHYTAAKVIEDLGDEAIDDLYSATLKSGVIMAVKGCETYDEIKEKWDNDEEVKGIIITIVGGKAIKAEYRVINESDAK